MLESSEDLSRGLNLLSNYFHKYLETIERNIKLLRLRLDEQGMTGHVQLWRKAHDFKQQMEVLVSVAQTPKEEKAFLGVFFALQTLQIHFLNIDWLRRESSQVNDKSILYRHILTRCRFQRKDLISAYLSALMNIFSGGQEKQGILLCNVGMIMDQDDLDIGVFIDEDIDTIFWGRIISQVSNEFFKYATKMHFYLAERVSENTFLTTVHDVKNYLKRKVSNFILISELLLAEPLLGDRRIADRLERDVIDHFYFDKGNRRLHEGYLRGIMGEVQENLNIDIKTPLVRPKSHGLRLVHSTTNMLKTIYGIREHGSREILDILSIQDPESADHYNKLQEIFNFIEMFFYIYQLIVSVEDSFDFKDRIILKNLDQVAEIMGFHQLGIVRPSQRLLTHYYENLDALRRIVRVIMDKVNKHLKKITIFNQVFNEESLDDYPIKWSNNIAENVLKVFNIYSGMIYWDDVLQMLAENDALYLKKLVSSLNELSFEKRNYVFNRLLVLLSFDMDSMIITSVLFAQYKTEVGFYEYYRHMYQKLMEILEARPNRLAALIKLLASHPQTIVHFLRELSTSDLLNLRKWTKRLGRTLKVESKLRRKFTTLCELIAFSSNNYQRYFSHVVCNRPEIVTHIDEMQVLESISDQLWAELSDAKKPDDLKKKLEIYYEFSFCRCGLIAIHDPGNLKRLYSTYHEFFRRYFRWLYRASIWDVEVRLNAKFHFRNRDEDDQPISIFCTGGYAREEAFENDIDLIVLCRNDDADFMKFASQVINDINRRLNRRGVMPHHRFADFFNSFVIPVHKLEKLFETPRENDHIELSQLQNAVMLVGGQSFSIDLSAILDRFLFNNPREFILKMVDEIKERHTTKNYKKDGYVNIKEDPGALRDIQIIVSACQAYVKIREPVIWSAFQKLSESVPELKREFKILNNAYNFIRFFKDIHSISLTETDDIMNTRLMSTARRMGFDVGKLSDKEGTVPALLQRYRYHINRSRQAINKVRKYLLEAMGS